VKVTTVGLTETQHIEMHLCYKMLTNYIPGRTAQHPACISSLLMGNTDLQKGKMILSYAIQ
jgi:hypothetical protein